MRRLAFAVLCFLPAGAAAAPQPQTPVLSRVVVAEAVKALETSPVGAEFRTRLAAKRKELEAGLVAAQQKSGLVAAPQTAEEHRKMADLQEKSETAKKQLESFFATCLPDGLGALGKAIEPKLHKSRIDYLLDASALIRYPRELTKAAQIEPNEAFVPEQISECHLVRVNLEEINTKTRLGKALWTDLLATKSSLEKSFAGARIPAHRAEADWNNAVATHNRTLSERLSAAYREARGLQGPLCLLHAQLTDSGRTVVHEPKRAPVAKIPDSTAWFVANLDAITDKLAAAQAATQARRSQRTASVATWVARLAALAPLRGSVVAAVPKGWKEAWVSTDPFEPGAATLVGTDSEGLPRVQVVFATDLAVDAAIALAKEVDGAIDDWSDDHWSPDSATAPDLPDGLATAGIWAAVDDKDQRKNGTLLLLTERQSNHKYRVVLQLAEAQLAWPLK